MKNLIVLTFMMFGLVFTAAADNTTLSAEKRAENISDQMIRELRLNNYQANKLRAINLDKMAKMQEIEAANAGNQDLIDQKCKEVLAERDRELEKVLSTVQYSNYFGNRNHYNQLDKEYSSLN